MDMWLATDSQIKIAAKKFFRRLPVEINRQSGLWAYVYFADGTNGTIYQWMVN